jgi:hypothetical protein
MLNEMGIPGVRSSNRGGGIQIKEYIWIVIILLIVEYVFLVNLITDKQSSRRNGTVSSRFNARIKQQIMNLSSDILVKTSKQQNTSIPVKSGISVLFVLLVHISGDVERLDAIAKTWFRSYGDDLGLVMFGTKTGQIDSPILFVEAKEHQSPFEVTRSAFSVAARSFPSAKLFAKFDDDSYVYTRALFQQIKTHTESGHYWGYPMTNLGQLYGMGGAGYILDVRAVSFLLERCPDPLHSEWEDLAVGCCLSRNNVHLTELVGLHPHHPYQMLKWDKEGHPQDRVRRNEPLEGYMNPISYHYVSPTEILQMHDDIFLHGFPRKRTSTFPKIIHQFWEGNSQGKPEFFMQKCKDLHPSWTFYLWNNDMIKSKFPSKMNSVGHFETDGQGGQLLNQDFYQKGSHSLNLLSDILRYEVLLFYGGVYVDADEECLRPIDYIIKQEMTLGQEQGFAFLEKDETFMGGLIGSSVIGTYPFSPMAISLVSDLRHTDWGLAPWQSAGPLYLTKILRQFNDKSSDYEIKHFHVKILPSFLAFPYHHSDQRPAADYYHTALIEKGAAMDQNWGSTFNSYGGGGKLSMFWQERPPLPSNTESGSDQRGNNGSKTPSVKALLDEYTKLHDYGLSTISKQRPRWVVAEFNTNHNDIEKECDAVSHIVSSLLFAIVTGRTLLFDWEGFESLKFYHSYTEALRIFGLTHESAKQMMSITKNNNDKDFIYDLKTKDLDKVYYESIIYLKRDDDDWWWGALLVENPLYSQYIFGGKSAPQLYSMLANYLFPSSRDCADPTKILAHVQPDAADFAVTGAFVFNLINASDNTVRDFQLTLLRLHTFFNNKHHYPVILFVDNSEYWRHVQFTVSSRIHLVQATHLSHEALKPYEYVIWMEYNVLALAEWKKDPFAEMARSKSRFGIMKNDGIENMQPQFKQYELEHINQADLIKNFNVHSGIFGMRSAELFSAEYLDFCHHFETEDLSKLLGFYVGLHAKSVEVEYFDYIYALSKK